MRSDHKLKNSLLVLALAAVYPLYGHAAAGIAQFTSGDVNVRRNSALLALSKGRNIESGDSIVTGPGGRAQLRFSDGGIVSLQPDSQFDITKYVDANDGKQDSFLVNFTRGSMRAITGLIGKRNRENYQVQTATATVGIRGSGFSASYNADGTIAISTELDEIEVCTKGGCVRLAAGESCLVVNNNEPPARNTVRANLPTPAPRQEITVAGNKVTNGGLTALITVPVATPAATPAPAPALQPVTQIVSTGWNAAFISDGGSPAASVGANGSGTDQLTLLTAAAPPAVVAVRAAAAVAAAAPVVVPSPDPTTQLTKFASTSDAVTLEKLTLLSYDSRGKVADADFIGWGQWATASKTTLGPYGGASTVNDLHYVIGKPTAATEITALSGMTGTYGLIGGTASFKPYSGASLVGTVTGGSLTVQFNNPSNFNYITGSVDTKFGATTVNVNLGTSSGCGARFSGGAANVAGFFTGANAARAGLVFKSTTGALGGGTISGSAAFVKTGLAAPG